VNLDWSKCQPYSGFKLDIFVVARCLLRGSYGWWRAPGMSQLAVSAERCLGRPSRLGHCHQTTP
jgi:hypothetical protein